MSPRKRAVVVQVVQYGLLVAAVGAIILLADWETIGKQMMSLEGIRIAAPRIPPALLNTLQYTLGAFAVSLSVGMALALMKLSSVSLYRWLATIYIEFFRGLPALLVVIAVAFGVPLAMGVKIPGVTLKAALALGLVSAAYLAESLRAGIQAVPHGQVEAARSLGLSHSQTLIKVVIPQAIRIVLPPVTNEIILLTKDTSLVYVMGLTSSEWELTKAARESLKAPVGGLTSLFAIGACYLIITIPLSFAVRRMEKSAGQKEGAK
ncbi:MAG: amino acid ABC transporter permease [Micrococcales bacterium]|nr:amino acid ABC transporter permease [Micrococcales bacterium]